MILWGSACSEKCGWCGACSAATDAECSVPREHLGGEEIYHEGQFVGTIAPNADGTWQIDANLEWGNLTSPNQPDRATAIRELIEHAAYRRRIDALQTEKVTR